MPVDRIDAVTSLAKHRGFVFPSSEIYGGTRSAWDYGPLGVELKDNVRRQWWRTMVQERDDIVGLDSAVILARQVWEASGHIAEFVDPLTECQFCHKRFRADHLEEAYEHKHGHPPNSLGDINCPNCGNKSTFTEPKMFNGLMKTYLGPVESEEGLHYLRPETAQGIFINYRNVEHVGPEEAAVRHRAGRQELPQRDHAGQLHLPHARVRADGDGVLRRARHRRAVARVLAASSAGTGTSASACPPTTCASSSTRRRSCRTTRSGRSTSNTASGSAAPNSPSSKASPTARTSTCPRTRNTPASTCRTSTRRKRNAGCRT